MGTFTVRNQPQTEAELEAIRPSVVRGQPYGNDTRVARTAKDLRLESTIRARGRAKNSTA